MSVEECTIDIEGVKISYGKAGSGPHNVIMFPGGLGTWQTDFGRHLKEFSPDEFTLVSWDAPGYGRSRPPERDLSDGYNARDALTAHKLMTRLGLLPYSVMGHSDGGVTALYAAHQQRDSLNIRKVIVWATSSFVTKDQLRTYDVMRDIAKWPRESRETYIDLYGREQFIRMWNELIDARQRCFDRGGDKCSWILSEIPQPTLVIYGEVDLMSTREHANELLQKIPNSRCVMCPRGPHSLHSACFDWFKKQVELFLCSQWL